MARKNSSTPQKQPAANVASARPSGASSGSTAGAWVLSNPNLATVSFLSFVDPSLLGPLDLAAYPYFNRRSRLRIPAQPQRQVVSAPAGTPQPPRHSARRVAQGVAGLEAPPHGLAHDDVIGRTARC